MSKSIAMRLLGLGAIFFAMLRTECSDKQNPTPSARIVPGPAIAAQLRSNAGDNTSFPQRP